MPENLNPQDQWDTQFEVPLPGEPRNIGPLRTLFQRLLNRTERLKNRIAEILGLPWDASIPEAMKLSNLHSRMQALESGGGSLENHRTATPLDHPDGSVTTAKIANGAVTAEKLASGAAVANIGYTPANKAGDTFSGPVQIGPSSRVVFLPSQGTAVRIQSEGSASISFREESSNNALFQISDTENRSYRRLSVGTSGSRGDITLHPENSGLKFHISNYQDRIYFSYGEQPLQNIIGSIGPTGTDIRPDYKNRFVISGRGTISNEVSIPPGASYYFTYFGLTKLANQSLYLRRARFHAGQMVCRIALTVVASNREVGLWVSGQQIAEVEPNVLLTNTTDTNLMLGVGIHNTSTNNVMASNASGFWFELELV